MVTAAAKSTEVTGVINVIGVGDDRRLAAGDNMPRER
jgi:hypothetical protein